MVDIHLKLCWGMETWLGPWVQIEGGGFQLLPGRVFSCLYYVNDPFLASWAKGKATNTWEALSWPVSSQMNIWGCNGPSSRWLPTAALLPSGFSWQCPGRSHATQSRSLVNHIYCWSVRVFFIL